MTDRDAAAPLERWAARASVVAVAATILIAGLRAAVEGWIPIGDNGLLVLRSRDVLTAHHPWLGTWTSASLSVGTPINNPGPLQFDLLAPFAKLDPGGGVAIGASVLNALAVVLAAVFARRAGGSRLVALTMVAAGGLAWSMGSELLADPWQPHAMLLPFLALLVLAVALATGDATALPWAVFVGSLIVQAHLSYAVLVPGVLFVGLGWGVLALRRMGPPLERRSHRRRWGRAVGAAALVGLLCWAQPVWEQVAREGNLVAVVTNAGGGDAAVGPEAGVRLAGSVLGEPTGWLRPSFEERFAPDPSGVDLVGDGAPLAGVRSLPAALASLLALTALLSASAALARRRLDRRGVAVAAVTGAAAALAVATAASLPVSEVLGIAPHQLRWLWPIAAASAVLPLAAVLPRHRAVTGAAALVAVGLAVATVPAMNASAGPSADVAARPAVRSVLDQLDAVPDDEVVYFDGRSVPFAEPFSGPILLELQRRGIEFEVDEEFSYQVGPARRGPVDATSQLRLYVGTTDVDQVGDGGRVVAVADGLSAVERSRLRALPEGDPLRTGLQRRSDRFSVVVALEPLEPLG